MKHINLPDKNGKKIAYKKFISIRIKYRFYSLTEQYEYEWHNKVVLQLQKLIYLTFIPCYTKQEQKHDIYLTFNRKK